MDLFISGGFIKTEKSQSQEISAVLVKVLKNNEKLRQAIENKDFFLITYYESKLDSLRRNLSLLTNE